MTTEEQYLTYAEYQALGGSAIGEKPFNLLEFEARKRIDTRTLNRLKGIDEIPQEVKICEYNLINSINSYNATSNNKNITSENIDGYSVSYVNATQISDVISSKNDELNDIITTYLFGCIVNGEHIIYSGI